MSKGTCKSHPKIFNFRKGIMGTDMLFQLGLFFFKSRQGSCKRKRFAIRIAVTRYTPHRSVLEELPHTAHASGNDAKALQRIRMAYAHWGYPFGNKAFYPYPGHFEPAAIHGNPIIA